MTNTQMKMYATVYAKQARNYCFFFTHKHTTNMKNEIYLSVYKQII